MTARWCSGESSVLRTVAATAPSCSISIVSVKARNFFLIVARIAPEASLSSNVSCSRSALPSTRKTLSPRSSVTQKSSLMLNSRSLTR